MKTKLTEEQQTFIVQRLACFTTYAGVVEAVKEEFDIDITRHLVREYDSLKNEKLAPKWREIYAATHREFLKSTAEIGIAHRTYRLHQLQRLYHQAGKNIVLKMRILEQAAKEVGGLFTNKRVMEMETRDALAALLGVHPDQLPLPGQLH